MTKAQIVDEAVRRLRWSLRDCPHHIDGDGLRMWLIFHDLVEPILDECRRIRALEA